MWPGDKELAINGGPPVRTQPWLENLTFGEEEKRAVQEVMEKGILSFFEGSHNPAPPFSFWGGPRVQQLERAWCETYGIRYAVSMNSATSCLYAAVGALGLGYGDEIIVSPYTMSAAATCALVYGAMPVFADVRLETGSLDPDSIQACLTERTRAIVVVHQFGIPADMDPILDLARRHRLKIIEDCAQAHGAKYKGRWVGTFGDVGVFSLNVNKSIQTGEGGLCVTREEDLRLRLALIRNHAEAVVEEAAVTDPTNMLGFNYRLTELTAAIAVEQLKKLERLNAIRREYVHTLSQRLRNLSFLVPPPHCSHRAFGQTGCGTCVSTYYLYPLRFLGDRCGLSRRSFAQVLAAEGVPFTEGYARPLYLQPLYQKRHLFKHGYPFRAPENQATRTSYAPGTCPNAEKLYEQQMLANEFVRPPHRLEDVLDIARAIEKIAQSMEIPLSQ